MQPSPSRGSSSQEFQVGVVALSPSHTSNLPESQMDSGSCTMCVRESALHSRSTRCQYQAPALTTELIRLPLKSAAKALLQPLALTPPREWQPFKHSAKDGVKQEHIKLMSSKVYIVKTLHHYSYHDGITYVCQNQPIVL